MRQEEKDSSGNLTDDQLRNDLALAVAAAARVISGNTMPLPFDDGVDASVVNDITNDDDIITPESDLPM